MVWDAIKIFLIGILWNFLASFNTKTIEKNSQFLSFFVSFISDVLGFYGMVMMVENLRQLWLILLYACGGGFGDVVAIRFDKQIGRLEMAATGILKMVRFRWPVEIVTKRKLRFRRQGQKWPKKTGFLDWFKNLFNLNHKYRRKVGRRMRRYVQ